MNGLSQPRREYRPSNIKPFDQSTMIALAGNFGENRSHEALRRWIKCSGGRFTSNIDENTTHLVVSRAAWKAQGPIGTEALFGHKQALSFGNLKILTYDWLEDCLIEKQHKPELAYHPQSMIQERKNARRQRKQEYREAYHLNMEAAKDDFDDGSDKAIQDLGSPNWHIYRDSTIFLYSVQLQRSSIKGRQLFVLTIYESNDGPPFAYTTAVRYAGPLPASDQIPKGIGVSLKKDDKGALVLESSRMLTPLGCSFACAYDTFRRFFELQTGVLWEYRIWGKDRFAQEHRGAFDRETIAKSLFIIGPGGEGKASNMDGSIPQDSQPTNNGNLKNSKNSRNASGKLTPINRPTMMSNLLLRSVNPIAPNIPLFSEPVVRLTATQLRSSQFLNSYGPPALPPATPASYHNSLQAVINKRYFIYAIPPPTRAVGRINHLYRGMHELGTSEWLTAYWNEDEAEDTKCCNEDDGDEDANMSSVHVKVGGKQITVINA